MIVACPTCQKDVHWHADSPHRPFCSERCKLIDLGEWASESYAIAAQEDNAEWQAMKSDE